MGAKANRRMGPCVESYSGDTSRAIRFMLCALCAALFWNKLPCKTAKKDIG